MTVAPPPNPFDVACDPRIYVPRPASETALGLLSTYIAGSRPAILLHGPAGIGKTMLLGVLAERLGETHQVVYVSVSPPEAELTHRIVNLLGEPSEGSPHDALVAAAARSAEQGYRLVLLIDHAAGAPLASSIELLRTAAEAAPHMSVVFSVSYEDGATDFARALAEVHELDSVGFDEPMTRDESVDYVWTRLAQGEPSTELLERLDDASIEWVLDGSQGLPRIINDRAGHLIDQLEQETGDAPPAGGTPDVDPAQTPLERPHQPYLGLSYDESQPTDSPSLARGSLGGGLIGGGPRLDPEVQDSLDARFGPGFLNTGSAAVPFPDPAPHPPSTEESLPPVEERFAPVLDGRRPEAGSGPVASPTADPEHFVEPTTLSDALTGGANRLSPEPTFPDADHHFAPPTGAAEHEAEPAAQAGRGRLIGLALAALAGIGAVVLLSRPEPDAAPATEPRRATPSERVEQAKASPPAKPTAAKPAPAVEKPAVAELTPPPRPEAVVAKRPPAAAAPNAAQTKPRQVAAVATPAPAAAIPKAPPTQAKPVANKPAPAPVARTTPPGKEKRAAAPAETGPRRAIMLAGAAGADTPRAYVRVRVDLEPGSILTVDGQAVGTAPIGDLMLPPGPHTFVAEDPEGLIIEQLVEVSASTDVVEF